MSLKIPECPVCYENYDLTTYEPRLICTQGHSCCLSCAMEILNKSDEASKKCPVCRGTNLLQNVKNFALISAIESSLSVSKTDEIAEQVLAPAPAAVVATLPSLASSSSPPISSSSQQDPQIPHYEDWTVECHREEVPQPSSSSTAGHVQTPVSVYYEPIIISKAKELLDRKYPLMDMQEPLCKNTGQLTQLQVYHNATYRLLERYISYKIRALLWDLPQNLIKEVKWNNSVDMSWVFANRILVDHFNFTAWGQFTLNHGCFKLYEMVNPIEFRTIVLDELRSYKNGGYPSYTLAYCFEFGIGIEKDLEAASEIYQFLAKNDNHLGAKIKCALMACNTKKIEKSIKILKKTLKEVEPQTPEEFQSGIKVQSATIMYKLAELILLHTKPSPKKRDKAMGWLRLSSTMGFSPAKKLLKTLSPSSEAKPSGAASSSSSSSSSSSYSASSKPPPLPKR